MPFRRRNIARELVTAIAVLGIYVLVLLAPLHQAAGLQRSLNELGFAALDNWSICAQIAQSDDAGKPDVVKCAVAGIGKNEMAPLEPVALDAAVVLVAATVHYSDAPIIERSTLYQLSGQPRAPPVLV
ncbi:hypothetical protein [Devosia epidermidihirudinis]|uniref:hypothetical protein n=1 Tax=Devosia epidermidihirudinis TaxID=1293439 RepID=UPI000AC1C618|nr:hypothetical protein [Devosia epidermidihirudinis]